MIKDYKFGIAIGFVFGLLSIYLTVLGLISSFAGVMSFIFRFPGPLVAKWFVIQTGPYSYSSAVAMPVALLLNGIFYAIVGGFLQKWLGKKKYVIYVFGGWIILTIIMIIIEYFVRSSLGLHVGP